jgi:DNA-binding beta-propeller fold protein YncE
VRTAARPRSDVSIPGAAGAGPADPSAPRATRGTRRLGLTLSVIVLVAGLSALLAPGALAARGHVFSGTIGEACTEEPCAAGKLKEPSAVAVNEATGEIYVLDQGNDRVQRFDATTGAFLGQFDGSGSYEPEPGVVESGTPAGGGGEAGEIPTGRFEFQARPQVSAIAVDNSCSLHSPPLTEATTPTCAEFDPSYGDLYVVEDAGNGRRAIDKFAADGAYRRQITEAGGVSFQTEGIDGVAVDAEGKVWVYRDGPVVDGFQNTLSNGFIETVHLHSRLGEPGFAIDSEGNFYAAYLKGGSGNRIAKDDHSGQILVTEVGASQASGVAVDHLDNDSFLDNLTSIRVSDPVGGEIERLGQEGGANHLTEGAGIGVSSTSESVYVADDGTNKIVVFGPTEPSVPTIEAESTTEVTAESAVLGAEINPRSETNEGPTEYQFEYGACSSGTCAGDGYEAVIPATPGVLPADFEIHTVTVQLAGLRPNTTYHFRAIARNALGQAVPGQEKIFQTQGSGQLILPDSRQWELVSPAQKLGARIEPISETGTVQVAADGSAITYLTSTPTELEPLGNTDRMQTLSSRSSHGWLTRDIGIPHLTATGHGVGVGSEYKLFSSGLTVGAVQPFGQFNPALSEEASEATAYLHTFTGPCSGSCYRPLVTGKSGVADVDGAIHFGEEELCKHTSERSANVVCGPEVIEANEALTRVVLRASAELKSGAGLNQLYEWSGGQLSRVSVLPGPADEPAPERGVRLGFEDNRVDGAISADGARIVWEAQHTLYQRDTALGRTAELAVGGRYQAASADGSRVLFTDTNQLTATSGAVPDPSHPEADLYECNIEVQGGEPTCDLTDLTPANGAEGADVQGQVLGASADASTVYFVAKGTLGDSSNSQGEEPILGQANLYVHEGSSTRFIATLAAGDSHDWAEELGVIAPQPTRVTDNGSFLEFMSAARLTRYDNRDVSTGTPVAEVYVYDAATRTLSCASCDPTGARPAGVEYFKLEPGSGGLVGGPRGIWPASSLVAANVPGRATIQVQGQEAVRHQPRYLSNSGRLFFDTVNGLVSQDSNGTQDVYEWEPPGVGDCTEAAATFQPGSGGCLNLISSGSSGEESAFLDASETGDDVFFLTDARLAKEDTDNALDVYDAHVCSASVPCLPEPTPAAVPCSGEGCQAPATAPVKPSPQSLGFAGPGNLKPAVKKFCPKGKVKRGGKCVKKRASHRHHRTKKRHAKSKTGRGK